PPKGPRSLITTWIDRAFARFVTVTTVPNGSHGCAAVKPSPGANEYQLATPDSEPWGGGLRRPISLVAGSASSRTTRRTSVCEATTPSTTLSRYTSRRDPGSPSEVTRTSPGASELV